MDVCGCVEYVCVFKLVKDWDNTCRLRDLSGRRTPAQRRKRVSTYKACEGMHGDKAAMEGMMSGCCRQPLSELQKKRGKDKQRERAGRRARTVTDGSGV